MLKKNMIKAYQNTASVSQPSTSHKDNNQDSAPTTRPESPSSDSQTTLYRSKKDEKLIKDYHFAKFQKNLDQIQHNSDLKQLMEKEEWDESDIKALLANFR